MQKHNEDFNSASVLAELLTRFTGRGGLDVIDIAVECGCSKEAVYAARKGVVSLDLGMKMLRCLPDEAVTEFFASLGFHGARRTDGGPACHHEAGHELAQTTAAYVDAARDGRIDHIEERLLTRHYFRVIACLSRLTARAGA
jgi:hypothetical protein